MKPGYSIWIKNESGDKIFGQGPYQLLILIDKLGSLNKAASEMKMSYSKANSILKKAEKELNIKLVHSETGGANGGGSKLTLEARNLIDKYTKYRDDASVEVERIYKQIFCT